MREMAATGREGGCLDPSRIKVATARPLPYPGQASVGLRRGGNDVTCTPRFLPPVQGAGGLTSIFFGGGTPSLTPPPLINKVSARPAP